MQDKIQEKEFKDILQKEISLKRTTFTEEQMSILMNPKFRMLIKIIHTKKYLTFDEIVSDYQNLDTFIDSKSESTIYRLLQTLKEYDLVIEIGQRITEGQILTKTLFSLSAEYFIIDEPETDWTSEMGISLFLDVLESLKICFKDNTIHEMKLYNWLINYQQLIIDLHEKIFATANPKILEHIAYWSYPNPVLLLKNSLFILILLKNENLVNDLKKCFLPANFKLSPNDYFQKKIKSEEKKNHQDVILKIPEIYHMVSPDNPYLKKMNRFELRKMYMVLESGPLTSAEIVEKYNEISIHQKKQSTIYRYIKTLKDMGIVIEIGQRVIQGKKATEKLLSLSGRWIISQVTFDATKEGSYLQIISDKTIDFIHYLFPEYGPINREKYRSLGMKGSSIENKFVALINAPENIEMKKIILLKPYKKFLDLYNPLGDIHFYLNFDNVREEFLDCFEEKKN
ncbi:MAG: hypothetical protein ACFFDW_03345 [Candidatus Thorarchaeota archaeon]